MLDLPRNVVQGLVDAAGTVTHGYWYTPFGEPLPSSSSAIVNPLRFAARELDDATGLYYVRARWYDPSRGRFMSEDPIGLAGGINNYAYAANDPVNLSDPSGLCYGRMAVTILGEVDPCPPRGWLGLGFLMKGWSGIGDRDGRITSIMEGMVKGGGQDDGSGAVGGADDEGWLSPQCKKKAVLVVLQGAGDWLAVSGVVGAYRAVAATGLASRIASRRTVQPIVVTQAQRSAAWGQIRSETLKAAAGAIVQIGTGYVQGDSWDYSIPGWGFGRRVVDAVDACTED